MGRHEVLTLLDQLKEQTTPVTAVLTLALIFVVLGWLGLRRQEI